MFCSRTKAFGLQRISSVGLYTKRQRISTVGLYTKRLVKEYHLSKMFKNRTPLGFVFCFFLNICICIVGLCWSSLFLFCLFETEYHCVALAGLKLAISPGWTWAQRSACLCLPIAHWYFFCKYPEGPFMHRACVLNVAIMRGLVWNFLLVVSYQHAEGFGFWAFQILDFQIRDAQSVFYFSTPLLCLEHSILDATVLGRPSRLFLPFSGS